MSPRTRCSWRRQATAAGGERLLLTNLHNEAMPLIRYDQADLAVVGDGAPCACGRRFRRLEAIQGRVMDSILRPDGSHIPPFSVTSVVREIPGVRRFQIVQERPGQLIGAGRERRPLGDGAQGPDRARSGRGHGVGHVDRDRGRGDPGAAARGQVPPGREPARPGRRLGRHLLQHGPERCPGEQVDVQVRHLLVGGGTVVGEHAVAALLHAELPADRPHRAQEARDLGVRGTSR